jgi:tetratricopeptide (TPR) repeat protein
MRETEKMMPRKHLWIVVVLWLAPLLAQAGQVENYEKHMATAAQAFQRGDNVAAEQNLKKAIEEAQAISEGHRLDRQGRVARSSFMLAQLYEALGRHQEAAQLRPLYEGYFRELYGQGHPAVAPKSAGDWEKQSQAAEYAARRGDLAGAEKQYRTALQEAEKLGPEDYRVGLSALGLADVLYMQQRFAEAERNYRRAKGILQPTLGTENPILARVNYGLGLIEYEKGNYAKAQKLLASAAKVAEGAKGKLPTAYIAQILDSHADVLRKLGRHEEAAATAARAQVILGAPR